MKAMSLSGAVAAFALPFLLTGCAASFQPPLPEYTGENPAYLRFNNSPVYTSLRQASGQILQPVPFSVKTSEMPDKEYSVNARFSIMGIKSSWVKKVDGSGPVSDAFANNSYMEYRVKPGETYSIKWTFTEQGMYSSSDRVWSSAIIPEAGHTYEITLKGGKDGDDIVINDVTAK